MRPERLDYGTLVEPWKVEKIVLRARYLGVPEQDIPDIQQCLVLDILTLKYDPKNTAGADEATVLIAVIDNKIIDLLRKQSGRQRGYERYLKQKGYTDPQRQALSYCENNALRCDLKQAIAALSDRQKAVCLGIMEGWSIRQIARRLHCRQETVRRTIKAIGRTFKARGIDQWFR